MKLELVSFSQCPFVHRTTTMLYEKGVPFELRYIDLDNKPEWFLAISPRGKVPVLVADGTPLFESAVLNEFIDETHPPRMLPSDPIERARQRAWIVLADDLFTAQYKACYGMTKDDFDAGIRAMGGTLSRFEEVVRGPFFAGATFGCVDVAVAPVFYRLVHLESQSEAKFLTAFPRVGAWARALATRSSVLRGLPLDFDREHLARLRQSGSYFARTFLT
jgi:glutathione S-transferase